MRPARRQPQTPRALRQARCRLSALQRRLQHQAGSVQAAARRRLSPAARLRYVGTQESLRARGSFRAAPYSFGGTATGSENQPATGPFVHAMFSLKAEDEKE